MEYRDSAIELSLRILAARDRDTHAAKMLVGRVIGVLILRPRRFAQQRHTCADQQRRPQQKTSVQVSALARAKQSTQIRAQP